MSLRALGPAPAAPGADAAPGCEGAPSTPPAGRADAPPPAGRADEPPGPGVADATPHPARTDPAGPAGPGAARGPGLADATPDAVTTDAARAPGGGDGSAGPRPGAAAPAPAAAPRRGPRDPRLDFFRGQAMFIILIAHIPNNAWNNWIPARFGFSDATEVFVFCSGLASALAFGGIYARAGWVLGTARIAHRVWQVYWAHIAVFLVTATLLYAITASGVGIPGKDYTLEPNVVPLFARTGEALTSLMTLRYVPGLFDILPMYLVILAMIPAVMAVRARAGTAGLAVGLLAVWAAANLGHYGVFAGDPAGLAAPQRALAWIGQGLSWTRLPAHPYEPHTWYFNPFAWQLVFFTGFGFGMGWLAPPPVTRRLVWLAAGYALAVLPLAFYPLYGGVYLPRDWAVTQALWDLRGWIEPLWWKSTVGALRYAHFLALAYLAYAAAGPGGAWLTGGYGAGRPPRWLTRAAGAALVVCAPYALAPGLLPPLDPGRTGLVEAVALLAGLILAWAALGPGARTWAARDLTRAIVPVVCKVGTQSLAVFMVSVPLSVLCNLALDLAGRDVSTRAATNLAGFAVLIATAYIAAWVKSHPWASARG